MNSVLLPTFRKLLPKFPAAVNIDYTEARELLCGQFIAYIFPDALLQQPNVHVDIIFPPLELLR